MKPPAIVPAGTSGTGKTTIGTALAKALGRSGAVMDSGTQAVAFFQ